MVVTRRKNILDNFVYSAEKLWGVGEEPEWQAGNQIWYRARTGTDKREVLFRQPETLLRSATDFPCYGFLLSGTIQVGFLWETLSVTRGGPYQLSTYPDVAIASSGEAPQTDPRPSPDLP